MARLDTRRGKDADVEELLLSAAAAVQDEAGTTAWFALKCGHNHYTIFAAFADDEGRVAHLAGGVARDLRTRAEELLASPLRIERCEVLASKLPADPTGPHPSKGVVLRLTAKDTKANRLEDFLHEAEGLVGAESQTLCWFALRFGKGEFGIFNVFPDSEGRMTHLQGQVPRELAKHSFSLLGGLPDPDMCDVLAEKISVPTAH